MAEEKGITEKTSNISEVKRMYFTQDSNKPIFEMQDGAIKKPYLIQVGFMTETVWLTDDELKVTNENIAERNKKDKWWKLW